MEEPETLGCQDSRRWAAEGRQQGSGLRAGEQKQERVKPGGGLQEVLDVMARLPQSPDLQMRGCVWDYLERRKDEREPAAREDLCLLLQDGWKSLPAQFLQNPSARAPRRPDAVWKARHGPPQRPQLPACFTAAWDGPAGCV